MSANSGDDGPSEDVVKVYCEEDETEDVINQSSDRNLTEEKVAIVFHAESGSDQDKSAANLSSNSGSLSSNGIRKVDRSAANSSAFSKASGGAVGGIKAEYLMFPPQSISSQSLPYPSPAFMPMLMSCYPGVYNHLGNRFPVPFVPSPHLAPGSAAHLQMLQQLALQSTPNSNYAVADGVAAAAAGIPPPPAHLGAPHLMIDAKMGALRSPIYSPLNEQCQAYINGINGALAAAAGWNHPMLHRLSPAGSFFPPSPAALSPLHSPAGTQIAPTGSASVLSSNQPKSAAQDFALAALNSFQNGAVIANGFPFTNPLVQMGQMKLPSGTPCVSSVAASVCSQQPSTSSGFHSNASASCNSYHRNNGQINGSSCVGAKSPKNRLSSHIKKPLNAFMLYMKEQRPIVMQEVGLKERQSAEINRILGRRWHSLTRDDQQKYYDMARQERQSHMQKYPGWSARDNYAINKKKKKRRDKTQSNLEMKKCRARFGVDQTDKWCKHCRRKKRCLRFREAAAAAGIQLDKDDDDDLMCQDSPPAQVSSTTNLLAEAPSSSSSSSSGMSSGNGSVLGASTACHSLLSEHQLGDEGPVQALLSQVVGLYSSSSAMREHGVKLSKSCKLNGSVASPGSSSQVSSTSHLLTATNGRHHRTGSCSGSSGDSSAESSPAGLMIHSSGPGSVESSLTSPATSSTVGSALSPPGVSVGVIVSGEPLLINSVGHSALADNKFSVSSLAKVKT